MGRRWPEHPSEVVSHRLFPEFKGYLAAGSRQASDVLADLARCGAVYESLEHEPVTTDLGRFLYGLHTMEVTTAIMPEARSRLSLGYNGY